MADDSLTVSKEIKREIYNSEHAWRRMVFIAVGGLALASIPILCIAELGPLFMLPVVLLLVIRHYRLAKARLKKDNVLPSTGVRDIGFGLAVGIYCLLSACRIPFYIEGFLRVGGSILIPWITLGLVVISIVVILTFGGDWKGLTRSSWSVRITVIGFSLAFIGIGLAFYFNGDPSRKNCEMFLKGSAKAILPELHSGEIQEWLLTVKYDSQSDRGLEDSELPDAIKRLMPDYATIDKDGVLYLVFKDVVWNSYLAIAPISKTVEPSEDCYLLVGNGYLAARVNSGDEHSVNSSLMASLPWPRHGPA